MALNSINTNIAAYYAQQNINRAAGQASASVARLSSGNRIVTAADDVAALAAGTTLQSQVATLRSALQNASQGGSLLQVADGALAQITDILQRQKSIAVQASSGSVDNTQRAFLDQEFQALSAEIDRLAGSTNFNGVKLLDGSVFQANAVTTNSGDSVAGAARLSLSSTQFETSDAVIFRLGGNAVTFSFTATVTTSVQVTYSATVSTAIDNLIGRIAAFTGSNSSVLTGYTFTRVGNSLQVDADSTGTLASQSGGLIVDGTGFAGWTSADATSIGTQLFTLSNATDAGLGYASTNVSGTMGDSLLRSLDNSKARITLTFDGNNSSFAGNQTLTIGGIAFILTTIASTSNALQAQIGSTFNATVDNIVQTLNAYTDSTAGSPTNAGKYVINQLEFRRTSNGIIVEGKSSGNVIRSDSATAAVATTITNASGAGNLTGTVVGVNTNGVNNADFAGAISGFTATFASSNTVNASVTIGDHTYTASSIATTPTSNTPVLFESADGGYFTVDLAANQGTVVADQDDADTVAARLNAAFSSLTFGQNRQVTSYVGVGNIITSDETNIGALNGTSFKFNLADFGDDPKITDLSITAPTVSGGSASLSVTVDGEVFASGPITTSITANSVTRLVSASNSNRYIEFRGPETISNDPAAVTGINISTADYAETVEAALRDALGLNSGGQSLDFQVGSTTTDILSISIGTATTTALFGSGVFSVTSQANASLASSAVDTALNGATSVRAGVGALQERFNFASAAISSAIQNQDAARGILLDTDIATESTNYATAQVKLQAGIAVLAQANLLPQNLLKLIG